MATSQIPVTVTVIPNGYSPTGWAWNLAYLLPTLPLGTMQILSLDGTYQTSEITAAVSSADSGQLNGSQVWQTGSVELLKYSNLDWNISAQVDILPQNVDDVWTGDSYVTLTDNSGPVINDATYSASKMRYPISKRAKNYVRSHATAIMAYQCVIERVQQTSYDETTLIATSGGRTEVYKGPCRVWGSSDSSSPVVLGDSEIAVMQSTQVSIPWDVNPVPKRHDEVQITDAPDEDSSIIGKRFQIQSGAKSGEMRATRTFDVIFMEKSYA